MRAIAARRAAAAGILLFCLAVAGPPAAFAQQKPAAGAERPEASSFGFVGSGETKFGPWRAEADVSTDLWKPGDRVRVDVSAEIGAAHLAAMAAAGIKADRLCVLVTTERTFDADGWMRLASDERMSTLLTPTGLAIEGGIQGAVTNRFGYQFGSPLDQFQTIPASALVNGATPDRKRADVQFEAVLPDDLPPGLYRVRVDLGVMAGSSRYNLNGYSFASRPFAPDVGTYFYSPVAAGASGTHASGRRVSAAGIRPRFPWVLLASYNSNGYAGVVADEDRSRFALSNRSIIPDEVILPLYNDAGARLTYSLEPRFPTDSIDTLQNVAWDWGSGELSVKVVGPDGSRVDLGTAPFVASTGSGPTTKKTAFTAWQPHMYGRYTVTATGWIQDAYGRRYLGGGTYRFWIAKRMTLATATFQGQPYPVGSAYGRDTQFNPAVPADVTVTASLYPSSDPAQVRSLTYSGRATAAGLFGAAQGMKAFPLDAPGEYHASLIATHTDAEGHLWVSTMRHAGVVYPEPSGVIARGKKLQIGSKNVDRGDTNFEGHLEADGSGHLHHIAFPYLSGDMLLMAAEGYGTNKIEPVLTCQMPGDTSAWDTTLNDVGRTNLRIKTSNGYSPHLYPEYISAMEYYYGSAPRPGFMGRFLVGESTVRAPYWSLSPNSFGGQIGASPNGDAPGDIYRLLGGVVLRRAGQPAMYSGYIASAFMLPKGTNNNRVVAAGSEDLNGPLGEKARFFLVGLRPGTAFPVGAAFRPALQIDPLLPINIRFTLTYPDGRQKIAEGAGDRFGSFAGPTAWPLDVAGVYRYQIAANWNGFQGRMPGLPESGGEFFVYTPNRPAGAAGLRVDGASQRTFSAAATTTISGSTTAPVVHYTLLTPGAVIEQGDLEVRNGRFQYVFDPAAVHQKVPLYDITSITTGKPQIGRVIHLTFFAEEKAGGSPLFDVTRVILRGTTVIAARPAVASTLAIVGLPAGPQGAVADQGRLVPRDSAGAVSINAASAPALASWNSRLDVMERSGELVVDSTTADPMLPGRTHQRLQQYYEGLPVVGAELTRQRQGPSTVSLFGTLHHGIALDPVPAIGDGEAGRAAERATGGRLTEGQTPSLVVLPLDGGRYALAWRAETRPPGDVRTSFVDASSGRVLLGFSTVKPGQPADARAAASSASGSPALAASRATIDTVRRYYVERAGRFVLDDAAEPVHVVARPWADVSSSRGLIARELAYAVLDRTAALIYRRESGALADAYADLVAASVAAASDGGQGSDTYDPWLVGEAGSAAGLRSLRDPARLGSPDHYAAIDAGADMLASSTVASHAFYLAIEGGLNRTSGLEVEGVSAAGRDHVERAFLRAFMYMLPASATFSTAREATIQSARDLYGPASEAARAIGQAWAAVGVR